jgi:hypothetical protein
MKSGIYFKEISHKNIINDGKQKGWLNDKKLESGYIYLFNLKDKTLLSRYKLMHLPDCLEFELGM